ncbi:MAG: hypothetical protein HN816_13735, partial [Gammaproteobacteria bacterium]|nr:hypothetical protein [Gammaproteobacteria bacterium]
MSDCQAVGIHRLDQVSHGRQSEYLYRLSGLAHQTQVRVIRRRRKTMALYVEKGLLTELRVPTNC